MTNLEIAPQVFAESKDTLALSCGNKTSKIS